MAIEKIESKNNNPGLSKGESNISETRDNTADKTKNIIDSKENPYEGMTKLQIEVNSETREIWIDNENLKVDSSDWGIEEILGVKVKINRQGDITEFLKGKFKGKQLFTHQAALREAKKIGKRLACADNDNNEFQAIIEKVGIQEFSKVSPGCRYLNLSGFGEVSGIAYWSSSVINGKYAVAVESINSDPKLYINELNKSFGLSVRLVKD